MLSTFSYKHIPPLSIQIHSSVLSRQFRICITKASGKAHTPKEHASKGSPYGRAPAIAGERVLGTHLSLSVGFAATSPKGRGFSLVPL